MDATNKWYVAQLKPNSLERAIMNLKRQGFRTFMPLCPVTKRISGQFKTNYAALFPGYLFVQLGARAADWRKINSTFGVSHLLSFNKSLPTPVPQNLIDGLMMRCDERQHLLREQNLNIGQHVRVKSGVFTNLIGEIETFVSSDRVRLLFEFMGQSSRTDISRDQLERL